MLRPQRMRAQLVRAVGAGGKIHPIREPFAEQHMHHGQCQQAVGPGMDRQVLVRQCRRARPVRVDHDQPRALPAGFLDKGPQVNVVAVDVRAPGHDEPGLGEVLRRRAQLDAVDA